MSLTLAGYSEVGQKDSLLTLVIDMGHHDVGGFDVTVQQALFVGVIERTGDRRDDTNNFLDRHSSWISIGQESGRIEPVDKVHRYPQLTLFLPTVVHTDDVGMPKCRSEIGFPGEASTELLVGRPLGRQQFQCVTPG